MTATLDLALIARYLDSYVSRGVYASDNMHEVREQAALCRAAAQREGMDWIQSAYCRLGFIRDKMPPEHVCIVQEFLAAAKDSP